MRFIPRLRAIAGMAKRRLRAAIAPLSLSLASCCNDPTTDNYFTPTAKAGGPCIAAPSL